MIELTHDEAKDLGIYHFIGNCGLTDSVYFLKIDSKNYAMVSENRKHEYIGMEVIQYDELSNEIVGNIFIHNDYAFESLVENFNFNWDMDLIEKAKILLEYCS